MKRPQVGPVSWRDGIHLTGTSIWCDAKRARDICFVSTASAVPHAKHGQLIASPETLQLLKRPGREPASQLAVPFGQPFTLGTQRIELFASGHAYGAASLLLHSGDQKLVYAGAVGPYASELGGAMDHRSCDVLVLSAPYGQAQFVFPARESVEQKLIARCQEICGAGGVAVLLVGGIGKALESAALLSKTALPLFAHRSFQEIAAALRHRDVSMPLLKRWNPGGKGGRVLLWPLSKCGKIARSDLDAGSRVILLSGRAMESANIEAAGADEGVAWSNQADHLQLVQYIVDSGAKRVFLTHSVDRGIELAAKLSGVSIEAIGPPEQLTLF